MKRTQSKPAIAVAATLPSLPGQAVLVLQGGGALGAYQVGVYQALHEAGIEPEWVIGTSIGAINGAIIAGNPVEQRLARLTQFWHRMQHSTHLFSGMNNEVANLLTVTQGISAFFRPNPGAWRGTNARVGIEQAAYYLTDPLRETLESLVDFDYIQRRQVRLTVGAVSACSGDMRYFDSHHDTIGVSHVMASCALPPAFPAVRIDGEAYWDGGIYSGTPIEVVLDDQPRRNSVIFSAQVWSPGGPEPETMLDVLGRQKDIQQASRTNNMERQRQLHRLRHVISQLVRHLPASEREQAGCQHLASWGCDTLMHVVKLNAPRLHGEDHTKDIDFSATGIRNRWQAGYDATRRILVRHPWDEKTNPLEGVIFHGDDVTA